MPTLTIDRCLHCATEIPARPPGRPGRPRHFCSDRCRKAHYRELRGRVAYRPRELASYPLGDLTLPPLPEGPDADELVAQTVLEARAVVATFAGLALVARRDFACRCEHVALDLKRSLDQHFPGV